MATGQLMERYRLHLCRSSRNTRIKSSTLAPLLAVFMACSAFAEARSVYIDSIEILTADSDLVVLGNITAVASDPGGSMHSFQVTIHVKETLKGAGGESIKVFAHTGRSTELEAWRDRKADLLFFLQRLELKGGLPIIELDRDTSHNADKRVVTMDFDVLTTRDEILRAARAGCSVPASDRSRTRFQLEFPPLSSPLRRLLGGGQAVFVMVPTDERLEQRGKDWAGRESVEYRYLATKALSRFHSKENVMILLKLLVDDLHTDYPDGQGGVTIRYPVRRPAYNVLRGWGVETKEPIEEVHVGADVWTPKDEPRAEPEPAK